MKKIFPILALVFTAGFVSCTKEDMEANRNNCLQTPPSFCATVRCSPDGKPVCGCNNVTYGSACEAQCAGVTSYIAGTCR
jgi:NAD(P)H-nitrite reductase large subunit